MIRLIFARLFARCLRVSRPLLLLMLSAAPRPSVCHRRVSDHTVADRRPNLHRSGYQPGSRHTHCSAHLAANIHHDTFELSRRTSIFAAAGCFTALIYPKRGAPFELDAQLPPNAGTIEAFFQLQVQTLQQSLDGFDARLAWYVPNAVLPAAEIGDPAKDFKSSGRFGDGHCGTFRPGDDMPYDICPAPGCAATDENTQLCCRHFAYLVPYSSSARSERSRLSTVVISPRLAKLPDDIWQAMLMHELGHCIDVHVYGRRYRLQDHPVAAGESAKQILADIDRVEKDYEARADAFGNAMLSPAIGRKLCYNPQTLLQALVRHDTGCLGTGAAGDARPMAHYKHELLAGFAPK